MKKAKTPEEEVEPLADPEPDIPPEITDPEDGEPDEKAAATPTIREHRGEVLRAMIEGRAAPRSFDVSGPHHS